MTENKQIEIVYKILKERLQKAAHEQHPLPGRYKHMADSERIFNLSEHHCITKSSDFPSMLEELIALCQSNKVMARGVSQINGEICLVITVFGEENMYKV